MNSKSGVTIPKEIIIWGTFGQVLLSRDVIEQYGSKIIAVFADDETQTAPFPDVPIYYGCDGLKSWTKDRDAHYLTQHRASRIEHLVLVGSNVNANNIFYFGYSFSELRYQEGNT